MKLLIHGLLDFRQLGFVAFPQFLQLGVQQMTHRLKLRRGVFGRLGLSLRQSQPEFALFAR